ncbi:MAG: Rab family GTPase [Candidatus Hodarchaeota archaeon]
MEQPRYLFKIVAVGSGSVGKTSLIRRYCESKFEPKYLPTLGIDFTNKDITVKDVKVRILCADTAGQEYFSKLRPIYYKGAYGALIVFDILKIRTFEAIDRWLEELKSSVPENIPKILVGNKLDLEEERKVTKAQAEQLAAEKNLMYFEASAKNGKNVDRIFYELTKTILKNQKERERKD